MNSIFSRRSVRKFKDMPVEEEKIRLLLKAAMSAPTARNQREWEFVAVTDKYILKELSMASDYTKPTSGAPLAIVPLADTSRLTSPDYIEQDLAAACENILIEAVELGLGAVWMGIFPKADRMAAVAKSLVLPDHIKAFAIIAIGYAAEEPLQIERYEEARVHYNHY